MKTFFKKLTSTVAISIGAVFLFIQPAFAQGGAVEALLSSILNVCYMILVQINTIPTYVQDVTQMAQSWNNTNDSTNVVGNNQSILSNELQNYNLGLFYQITNAQALSNQFLNAGSPSANNPAPPQNAGELGYAIFAPPSPLFPFPLPANTSDNRTKYISHASGADFIIPQPSPAWKQTTDALAYQSYYNTVSAIQSFNAYVLSGLQYNQVNDTYSNNLINQATSSNWFQQISTEPLGLVLRHMLMYTSSSFVLLNRMVTLQEQQLTALSMTNTMLLIATQQLSGTQLYLRASQSSRG